MEIPAGEAIMTIQASKPARRHDIDWLRVMAVLLLVPFHTARIFDIWEPFYAKNDQVSIALSCIFIGAIGSWHMPLFFLLAGASTWLALRFRSGGDYVKERFKRLVVPLIFGVLVLTPPQTYLGARTYGHFTGSLFQYYPQFFSVGPDGLTGYMGGFTPGHLWFILFLFVLSLVALPFFLHLKRENGRRLLDRLAVFLARPGALYLLAIPLVLTQALPDIGGKNPFYYLTLFIYGYILMSDARFEEALGRHKTSALIMGLGTLAVIIVGMALDVDLSGWLGMVVWGVFYHGFTAWCWLIALLGFGRKRLNFANQALKYASPAAYPFYIVHQVAIVLIGFYVVQWDVSVLAKFSIIVIAATGITLLVYDLLIKRSDVTRFLCGMKRRQKTPAVWKSNYERDLA